MQAYLTMFNASVQYQPMVYLAIYINFNANSVAET